MKLRHTSPATRSLVRRALTGLAAGALGLPLAGQAATSTDQFQVTATVLATCTIAANDLSFGNYDPAALAPNDAYSTISVKCTSGTPYNVGLNAGSSGDVANRRMTGPDPAGLGYGLYQDAARTTNWGNTVGTDTLAGTGTGAEQYFSVYGRIPINQSVQPGTYTDTIIATVSY